MFPFDENLPSFNASFHPTFHPFILKHYKETPHTKEIPEIGHGELAPQKNLSPLKSTVHVQIHNETESGSPWVTIIIINKKNKN